VGLLKRKELQQAVQLIFDPFSDSGGKWPTLGQLQRELNRRARVDADADAVLIVQSIPAKLLKSPRASDGIPAANEELILTPEGIARCAGGGEVIGNAMETLKRLARLAIRSDLSPDRCEHGVHFTIRQLAEASSLDSDPNAVSITVAILQSEGWVQDHGNTRSNHERELCARWEIQAFRSVKGFSNYRKIKKHIRRTRSEETNIPGSRRRAWRTLLSNTGLMLWLTLIIAIGTVLLVMNGFQWHL
jgi:hypothetical protein